MTAPIVRTAQGVTVTLYTGGWPRQCTVEAYLPNGVDLQTLKLRSSAQIRALHWVLGEVIAADPDPDKG